MIDISTGVEITSNLVDTQAARREIPDNFLEGYPSLNRVNFHSSPPFQQDSGFWCAFQCFVSPQVMGRGQFDQDPGNDKYPKHHIATVPFVLDSQNVSDEN